MVRYLKSKNIFALLQSFLLESYETSTISERSCLAIFLASFVAIAT